MKNECVICEAPLVFLDTDVVMECAICHKKEYSKIRCKNGHYVCNDCHMRGLNKIIGECMEETSADPLVVLGHMMAMPFSHIQGPEHHVMVGAALLTAYKNAGGNIDLRPALVEMMKRGKSIPGGAIGFWGACGAGISAGMFMSIVTKATPLSEKELADANLLTSKILSKVAAIGGPMCCKRNSFLSIQEAIDFTEENLGVKMVRSEPKCTFSGIYKRCIKERCPFYQGESTES